MTQKAFTLEKKLKEVEREISQRRWVYKGLVARKKLKPETAQRQIAILLAVAEDYKAKINEGPLFRHADGSTAL